jgi:hypothetical protein
MTFEEEILAHKEHLIKILEKERDNCKYCAWRYKTMDTDDFYNQEVIALNKIIEILKKVL